MFQGVDTLTPEHIAPAALFLASDLCGDRTGHVLAVAGARDVRVQGRRDRRASSRTTDNGRVDAAGDRRQLGRDRQGVIGASLESPMLDARVILNAAVDYIRRNPDEIVKAAVNAAGLRFGVPLAALRSRVAGEAPAARRRRTSRSAARRRRCASSLSVDAMGTPVRATRRDPDRRDRLCRPTRCASACG